MKPNTQSAITEASISDIFHHVRSVFEILFRLSLDLRGVQLFFVEVWWNERLSKYGLSGVEVGVHTRCEIVRLFEALVEKRVV